MSKVKKVIAVIICALLVAAIALAGVANYMLIGKKRAVNIALEDSGLVEADTVGMTSRLEWNKGIFRYEVEFYSDGVEYEYTIHALDGFILKVDTIGSGYTPTGGRPGNEYEDWQTDIEDEIPEDRELASREDAEAAALTDANLTRRDVMSVVTTVDSDGKAFVVEFATEDINYLYKVSLRAGRGIKEKRMEFIVPLPGETEDGGEGEETGDNKENEEPADGDIVTDPDKTEGGADSIEYPLSNRQAKKIALEDIGITQMQARRVRAVADTMEGYRVYSVDIYTDVIHYQYLIRAEDGRILIIDTEYMNVK